LKVYRATGFNHLAHIRAVSDAGGEAFAPFEPLIDRRRHWSRATTWRDQPPLDDHRLRDHQQGHRRDGAEAVYIADGHHRYETGLKYLEERREAGEVPDNEAAPNFCLMQLVG